MPVVIARSLQKDAIASVESDSSKSSDVEKDPIILTSKPTTASDDSTLGDTSDDRRFWFQRSKSYDSNAIATQPSVFDDPELISEYRPRPEWENAHRFDPSARWTWGEENKAVRRLDMRIMVLACMMMTALELDRSNIHYNLGNTIFKLFYLLSEIPAQLIGKYIGVDRWIPIQMTSWSLVALCQFWLRDRTSFLVCRALIDSHLQMQMILYLSYFYKHHELSIRLGFWYSAQAVADVLAGLLAYGILHLRGYAGQAGWRWLFLIEGSFTLLLAILSFLFLPPSVTQTASWARGKKGWFTEREEIILVNRIIREDPSKGSMGNNEPLTAKLVWQSFKDYDLWPLYMIGLIFLVPYTTISQYFTLLMTDFGFGEFNVILLAIPCSSYVPGDLLTNGQVIGILTRIILTYAAEILGSLAWMGAVAQVWTLPMLIYMNVVDFSQTKRWVAWTVLTLILSFPSPHALQAGWNSRNSNSVRSRALSAAMYNMCVQLSGIIASNVYQDWDAPRYVQGNRVLLALVCTNIAVYALTKIYYILRNRHRDRKWTGMTEEQRIDYIATTKDTGNKRLDFRFAH
ncbi:major facilitator superfamily domain-containing protein [Aspergillus minisclerotigenes]|uniref:Major facilitator superfamily domain-containing protein n=1 Tax=Aspergillus minisclerotigenes TaxID=656917 RepID=A0A5N6JNP3_9EURO|nr:major facilitator superfamily domain-containing protein [Aspergillus minisclerotigenes]